MESGILRLQDYLHLLTHVGNTIPSFIAAVTSPWGIKRESVLALALVAACFVHLTVSGRFAAWTHFRSSARFVSSMDSTAKVTSGSPSVSSALPKATSQVVLSPRQPPSSAAERTVVADTAAPRDKIDPLERVPFAARREPSAVSPTGPLLSTSPIDAVPATSMSGSTIAALASTLVGDPYVWGGTSPAGFDCSGLVWYVYQREGLKIPRDLPGQLASGTPVAQGDLQPGDIVFFANTYQPGLSHSGIYLSGGRFVSAIDEATGVAISNLTSSYWVNRYFAATRPR